MPLEIQEPEDEGDFWVGVLMGLVVVAFIVAVVAAIWVQA